MACNVNFLCENSDPIMICLDFVYNHNFRSSSLALFSAEKDTLIEAIDRIYFLG